jgi:hypothetical protein
MLEALVVLFVVRDLLRSLKPTKTNVSGECDYTSPRGFKVRAKIRFERHG